MIGRVIVLLSPLALLANLLPDIYPTDTLMWTNPEDQEQFQICNLTTGCHEQEDLCVSWNTDLHGLCIPLMNVSRCSFNSDCPKASEVCEFTSIADLSTQQTILAGVCVPGLFYMWEPLSCRQGLLQPLPCESDFPASNEDEPTELNRYCHRGHWLEGRCMPLQCNNHVDCGMVIVESMVYIGSCIHAQCEFQIHDSLAPTDERLLGVLKAMQTQTEKQEF